MRAIVRVQAHFRGWLARHRRFKAKVHEHIAAVQIVDKLVSNQIESKLLPDILIGILKRNEYSEVVGLYSTQQKSVMDAADTLLDRALRKMMRQTLNEAVSTLIDQYMRKKALKYTDEDTQDPLEGPILDPMKMLARSMVDDMLRRHIRTMLSEELGSMLSKGSFVYDFMIEGSFSTYFAQQIRNQVRKAALDTLMDLFLQNVVEDLCRVQGEKMIRDIVEETVLEMRQMNI